MKTSDKLVIMIIEEKVSDHRKHDQLIAIVLVVGLEVVVVVVGLIRTPGLIIIVVVEVHQYQGLQDLVSVEDNYSLQINDNKQYLDYFIKLIEKAQKKTKGKIYSFNHV